MDSICKAQGYQIPPLELIRREKKAANIDLGSSRKHDKSTAAHFVPGKVGVEPADMSQPRQMNIAKEREGLLGFVFRHEMPSRWTTLAAGEAHCGNSFHSMFLLNASATRCVRRLNALASLGHSKNASDHNTIGGRSTNPTQLMKEDGSLDKGEEQLDGRGQLIAIEVGGVGGPTRRLPKQKLSFAPRQGVFVIKVKESHVTGSDAEGSEREKRLRWRSEPFQASRNTHRYMAY